MAEEHARQPDTQPLFYGLPLEYCRLLPTPESLHFSPQQYDFCDLLLYTGSDTFIVLVEKRPTLPLAIQILTFAHHTFLQIYLIFHNITL